MTRRLYDRLMRMVGDREIEVLLFIDNRKRSIGYKRQALLDIAQGQYVMWCDSDDELLSLDEVYAHAAFNVDVICFNALCRNEDGSTFIVEQRLGNPIEHKSNGKGGYADIKRPPFQNCAWRRELVKNFKFPDSSYGEDYEWLKQCYEVAKSEAYIDKIIYKYNFDPAVSEAPAPEK
jgi:glycosyltransferase involved in cell wall biosynthesis